MEACSIDLPSIYPRFTLLISSLVTRSVRKNRNEYCTWGRGVNLLCRLHVHRPWHPTSKSNPCTQTKYDTQKREPLLHLTRPRSPILFSNLCLDYRRYHNTHPADHLSSGVVIAKVWKKCSTFMLAEVYSRPSQSPSTATTGTTRVTPRTRAQT